MKKRLLTVVVTGTVLALGALSSGTINADEYTEQIHSANSQIESINSEKAAVSSQVSKVTNELSAIQDRVSNVLAQQKLTIQESNTLKEEIAKLEELIAQRQSKLDDQMRAVQVKGSRSYVDFILNSESLSDILNRLDVVVTMVGANRDLIKEQAEDKAAVEAKEAEQQVKLAEQQKAAYELEVLKEELDDTLSKYSSTLATLSSEELAAITKRDGLVQEQAAVQARIAQEVARAEAERQAAVAAAQAAPVAQASSEVASEVASESSQVANVASSESSQASSSSVVATPTVNTPVVTTPVVNIPVVTAPVTPTVTAPASSSTGSAVSIAQQYLGVPYVWGGSSTSGFDCSGLTQYVFAQMGISLPRTTYGQETVGTRISLSQAQVGDLLFWGSAGSTYHVAIYMGNNTFIHAPSEGGVVEIRDFNWFMPDFAVRL
ncbi:C40 family peptidase [Granulicatella seriolae]|uniref:NlpC/P60 family protein n=1 Tax=Granulicatella seriolae TaxID=2967226 RepID=A0ABT1WQQ0_9LACT|nr:C40 family peptidase [Granulicatella seriolae]